VVKHCLETREVGESQGDVHEEMRQGLSKLSNLSLLGQDTYIIP